MRLSFRLRSVGISLGLVLLSAMAAAQETENTVPRCPPVQGTVTIDGKLDEWAPGPVLRIGEEKLTRKDASYSGPHDLSGEIRVARDATTLYVAGEIRDDTLYWSDANPSWLGDGVELFFDFHPDPASRDPEDGYDHHAHQLLLHPLAQEWRWNFAKFHGKEGQIDDPVDGLRLAGLPWRDASGATIGYTFELALPFANLHDKPLGEGAVIGFDVALSDSDGQPEQKNYGTWSGREHLSRYTARFGRLEMGASPQPPPVRERHPFSPIAPVAVLISILGALLFLWLARVTSPGGRRLAGFLERVRRIRLRPKVIVATVLFALVGLAEIAAGWTARTLTERDIAEHRSLAATIGEISREAGRLRLLEPRPTSPSPLVTLLAGTSVPPPVEYDYRLLPPVVEVPNRTLGGTPYLRRDIPLTESWSGRFLVYPPTPARVVTLVYSWHPDPSRREPPESGAPIAEVRFIHLDGRVSAPTILRWSRHVDAFDGPLSGDGTASVGAPEARVAFVASRDDGATEHGLQLDVELDPEASAAPLAAIEAEPLDPGGTVVLHGATIHGGPGTVSMPLPLARSTAAGLPTWASPFASPGAVLELSKDNDWIVLRNLDVHVDRLWIVASLRRGYPQRRFRAPVALVEAVFHDGSVEGPFRIENGISIEAELAPARQHSDSFESELAFEWADPGEARRRHFDVISLPLERSSRRLKELQFEFAGEDEIVRIASITVGTRASRTHEAERERLERGDEGYRIPAQDLESFAGIVFTAFRGGRAVDTSLPGESRERTRSRRLSRRQLADLAAAEEGLHETRVAEGERVHALLFQISGGPEDEVLELLWRSDVEASIGRSVALARGALSVLLAPLLVLIAADLLLRLPSLHTRFVTAFAAAAAVPVVLATFAVPQLVGSKIEGAEEESVLEKSAAVHRRLTERRSLARQYAEDALDDEALQEALRRRDSDDFRAALAAALRDIERSISAQSGSPVRVAFELRSQTSSQDEPIVVPEHARWTVFATRMVSIDSFAYRWSRLYASGVANDFDSSGEWQTTLVVELPLDRAALEKTAQAAGGGAQVLLYTPRGFPLTGTLESTDEESESERSRKQALIRRALAARAPVVEPQQIKGSSYTVAFDVLRQGTEPACLVATALPRTGTEALLTRVEAVSVFVFGAGILMQFLLAGIVVGSTAGRFVRTLGRAQLAAPDVDTDGDELARLDDALRTLRRDREIYRKEMSQLHEAVVGLGSARAPEDAVAAALDLVRRSIAPWGAILVVGGDDGRAEIPGGFRGEVPVEPRALQLAEDGPLRTVVRGDGEVRIAPHEFENRDDPESAIFAGAERSVAYPLGGEDGPRGALVLLEAADATRSRDFHGEYAAALARQIGLAIANARLVRLAVHDPDTGAYVATYFEQRLAEEVDRAVAARRPIALVVLRTDGLEPDRQQRNRRQRRRLAEIVRERAPGRAFVGLLDGGLVAVAVPESDRAGAEAFVRDLRRTVAEQGLPGLRLTVGAAACPEDAGSSEFLLAEARQRLSEASAGSTSDKPRLEDRQRRLVDDARALGAVFRSQKGIHLLETVERIAGSDLTILIEGETGTGKEVVAELIHKKSRRATRSLVKVNCAALPDGLLESELFGFEPGAFTGADRRKPGRFELADGGTLFLDEIGELPLATQVKLLRVLEDHVVEHLGGTVPIPVDVRVIAATNRDLRGEVAAGRFREDLFYRLNAIGVVIPPLRARKEDIPALAEEFVARAAQSQGRPPPTLAPDAMDLLFRHPWPGNVRELRNALEQAVVLSTADALRAADVLPALSSSTAARSGGRRPRPGGLFPAYSSGRAAPGDLTDRQRRVLSLLAESDWITNTVYCEAVGISTRTGLRDLKDLVRRGLLVMEGKRRGARYRLP